MQKPVRYYITQSDDQAVVRSVPVTVHAVEGEAREATLSAAQATPATEEHGRVRVGRLVRSAVRRDRDSR